MDHPTHEDGKNETNNDNLRETSIKLGKYEKEKLIQKTLFPKLKPKENKYTNTRRGEGNNLESLITMPCPLSSKL